jgi:hypothetical protein
MDKWTLTSIIIGDKLPLSTGIAVIEGERIPFRNRHRRRSRWRKSVA